MLGAPYVRVAPLFAMQLSIAQYLAALRILSLTNATNNSILREFNSLQ